MKWIKTFEELKTSVYRAAGNKLKSIGKEERGKKLIDYSSEKEWGFYSLWSAMDSDLPTINLFTKPTAEFTLIDDGIFTNNSEMSIEDMLDYWGTGSRELYFTITFKFLATQEVYKYDGNILPLFAFKVRLADLPYEEEQDDCTIQQMYNNNKYLSVNIVKPEIGTHIIMSNFSNNYDKKYKFNGIFSDRKSALKFKKELPNIITDEIRDKIFSIFSLIGAKSDDITQCMDSILNPSINYLYTDINPNRDHLYTHYDITQTNNTKQIKKVKPTKVDEKPDTISTTGNIKPVYNLKREQ